MDLNSLYEKQAALDKHILEKHNIKMSKEELLDNTILALLVEVGELANTTRCFKHWSTKGMMDKEIVLDELADVWHFYLSIGNQVQAKYVYHEDWNFTFYKNAIQLFNELISSIIGFRSVNQIKSTGIKDSYRFVGLILKELWEQLGFGVEEVEQAYLKKHEENYKRQQEGY